MTVAPLHRVRIRLLAPLGTPLTSGTLFGHLCWAVYEGRGEAGLEEWLDRQDDAPWILSDGFPEALLPRPLLSPSPWSAASSDEQAAAKADKRKRWVGVADYMILRENLSPGTLAVKARLSPWEEPDKLDETRLSQQLDDVRRPHNTIDRRRGTTPEEGGLYFVDEDWSYAVCPRRDVYVRTSAPSEEIRRLFEWVGESGYGRDATWGRGRFTVEGVDAVPELDAHEGVRRLSLSHGTITANMHDMRYRLVTHYGKVGEPMAAKGLRPWKRPLLLSRPGATFRAGDAGPFGELLAGVHQDQARIRHDARHVAIPYTEGEGA
jgi:CRISPR-associated protein Csm4